MPEHDLQLPIWLQPHQSCNWNEVPEPWYKSSGELSPPIGGPGSSWCSPRELLIYQMTWIIWCAKPELYKAILTTKPFGEIISPTEWQDSTMLSTSFCHQLSIDCFHDIPLLRGSMIAGLQPPAVRRTGSLDGWGTVTALHLMCWAVTSFSHHPSRTIPHRSINRWEHHSWGFELEREHTCRNCDNKQYRFHKAS